MEPVKLILVGGFLGAGKTTLLFQAARRLIQEGRRVGLITNDQAPDLVDTGLLEGQGLDVREVAGSCFCCDFLALLRSARELRSELAVDVLIAEPVGSCTDLSATLLQPLKKHFRQEFTLSPLSVLADPERLRRLLDRESDLHESASYIVEKQLEEADRILLNKTDRLSPDDLRELRERTAERFPGVEIRGISAQTGDGVEDWLAEMMADGTSGARVVDVDYDRYAEGEAVLGWLNAYIRLVVHRSPVDWSERALRLLDAVRARCRDRAAPVGHVKLLLTAGGGQIVGNFTRVDEASDVRGAVASDAGEARLVLNARVEMAPEELRELALEAVRSTFEADAAVEVEDVRSLRPGRPRPTHRFPEPEA